MYKTQFNHIEEVFFADIVVNNIFSIGALSRSVKMQTCLLLFSSKEK